MMLCRRHWLQLVPPIVVRWRLHCVLPGLGPVVACRAVRDVSHVAVAEARPPRERGGGRSRGVVAATAGAVHDGGRRS